MYGMGDVLADMDEHAREQKKQIDALERKLETLRAAAEKLCLVCEVAGSKKARDAAVEKLREALTR